MDRRIVGASQRVDNLIARAKEEPIASNDELKAEIARFLCVLSSGLLEEAIRILLGAFAANQSSPQIANFVSVRLAEFQNPKFEKILLLLSSFDPKWRDRFEEEGTSELKAAIDSIVNNRNQIAHGKTVGISLGTFLSYYEHVGPFIQDLNALLIRS